MSFYESHRRQPSKTPARRETLAFLRKSRDSPSRRAFGSLRLPRVPLGGFATSRSPLAAVAARGAEDNINAIDTCCSDIRNLGTFDYSPPKMQNNRLFTLSPPDFKIE